MSIRVLIADDQSLVRVLPKLGLRDRVQAVVLAYESGLVTPRRRRRLTRAPAPPTTLRSAAAEGAAR